MNRTIEIPLLWSTNRYFGNIPKNKNDADFLLRIKIAKEAVEKAEEVAMATMPNGEAKRIMLSVDYEIGKTAKDVAINIVGILCE